MTAQPRRFALHRDRDISGVSGTGIVALGVLWPDGTASVRWLGDRPSIVFWDDMADAEAVHGHGGATRIVWLDEETAHVDDASLRAEVAKLIRWHKEDGKTLDEMRATITRHRARITELKQQAAAPTPTADRGDLRDRIAHVLAADDGHPWDTLGLDTQQSYLDNAAAALAVLPAPAGRAAVLREAADLIDAETRAARAAGVLEQDQHRPCRDASAQLRRMAAETQHAPGKDGLPDRLKAVLTERFTALGNEYSRMEYHEKGPDGWPASHPIGPHHVAEVLRELLTADTEGSTP